MPHHPETGRIPAEFSRNSLDLQDRTRLTQAGGRTTLARAGLMILTAWAAFGQSFEVASVRPSAPRTGKGVRIGTTTTPGRLTYTGVSLKMILVTAYKVKSYQISGPDWPASDQFDVLATYPPSAPRDQIPLMLQALLAERFKLALHREQKELPVYALVVAKNGPKLRPAANKDAKGRLSMGAGRLDGKGVDLPELAGALSSLVDRPVLDMTQLEGSFDFTLDFTPDSSMSVAMMKMAARPATEAGEAPAGGKDAAPESTPGPSIFTVLQQQLGLRLEGRRAPVDMLVIDHVQRVPTEN